MLEELVDLAAEKSSDKRRELLGRICDLYFTVESDVRAERELLLFASVVARLLQDIDLHGRSEFSTRFAPDPRLPLDVVVGLARDEIRVATPVLLQSPTLTDDALVEIVEACSEEHRLAISKRPRIGERVSEKLVEVAELGTIESLAENISASIAEKDLRRIADLSRSNPSLRSKLTLRSDMPVDVVHELLPYLEPETAAKLQLLMDIGPDEIRDIVDKAVPEVLAHRSAASRDRIAVRNLVSDVKAGKLSLDAALTQVIDDEKPLSLALVLSLIADLPENQVANAVINVRQEPLAVICKAADISTEAYLRADRLRAQSVNLPAAQDEALRRSYSKVDKETALRALRFVKVRAFGARERWAS